MESEKYAKQHPTEILCMAYALNDLCSMLLNDGSDAEIDIDDLIGEL